MVAIKSYQRHFHLGKSDQYSDQMLKHLPEDDLKSIQKTFLYSKKPVYFGSTSYE